ncbi:MAG: class I SAM-dependent methyltransferase [Mycobacteriales bacterium]
MAGVPDRMWASGGAYEPYVGRWSRLVAERFVAWLDPAPGTRWLDVGCGTGALTGAVLSTAPAAVLALDRSRGYLEHARRLPGAAAGVADASTLPVRDAAVDRVVSGLVLNFLPDPAAAVAEMARACRPGGVVAGYVWDYAEGMQPIRLFWDAAVALDPAAAELDEGRRFPLCRPDRLAAVFAGLADVRSTAITVPTVFRDFGDYWTPFLGGQGPAPTYCAGLPEDARQRLRDRLRSMLADGPIPLSARAWAVRGTVTSTAPAPCT